MTSKLNNSEKEPYRKHQESVGRHQSTARKALVRGLFFLFLVSVVTYFGKIKPSQGEAVSKHGLVGWVFLQDGRLSLYLVLPNDGDSTNAVDNGERLFANPPESPELLDSNFIRYRKRDLLLLGHVNAGHVQAFCHQVQSPYSLVHRAELTEFTACPRSEDLERNSTRLFQDWSVPAPLHGDSLPEHFKLTLLHKGQHFCVSQGEATFEKPCLLWVDLDGGASSHPNAQLYLAPGKAVGAQAQESASGALVLGGGDQCLAFRMEEDGKLLIQKIWIKDIGTESEKRAGWSRTTGTP